MRIIIVGCGNVGYTLVEQLNGEGHEIMVIDTRQERVSAITDELDAMGIVGNGVSFKTLQEAGIAEADLLIAVTGSDEQNLLCCVVARRAGHCKTIARVCNPVYNSEIEFLRSQLGLDMIVNPELACAGEISRLFQFPSAVQADTFSRGRIELIHFKITKDCKLNDYKLMNIRSVLKCDVLICMVTRGDEVIVPNGDFIFHEGDTVSVISTATKINEFFRKIGINIIPIHTAMLVGGGTICYYLARRLLAIGIETKIIEKDRDRCEYLSDNLPKATIICGDGTDQKLLEEEGIQNVDGFAALTGLDEENILLSLHAKSVSHAKVVTKIKRITFNEVLNQLDLDSITYPRLLTAEMILSYVRSMNESINSNVENLYKIGDGRAEALEFLIKEESDVTGVPIEKMKLKKNILICSINRHSHVIIPGGGDEIRVGDQVVIVQSGYQIEDIQDILED